MLAARILLREAIKQLDRPFSYLVPDSLKSELRVGQYVNVPFGNGNRFKLAVVTEIYEEIDDDVCSKLKAINNIVDEEPVLDEEQIKLIDFIKQHYVCTSGDAISLLVPSVVGNKASRKVNYISLTDAEKAQNALWNKEFRSINHVHIIEYLLNNGEQPQDLLYKELKVNRSHIKGLLDKGFIKEGKKASYVKKEVNINEVDSELNDKPSEGGFRVSYELNEIQSKAFNEINICDDDPSRQKMFLLHGITGSGKTEVYLHLVDEVLKKGGSVLYLVPEISLTPQTINWIIGRFNVTAAVMHSGLSDKERYEQWDLIRSGEARIVIAARSGIFAPIKNLKLIILDEEHDNSYSSDSFPRYSSSEIAVVRAKYNNAFLILGSATPSIKSYYLASKGIYKLVEMDKRANKEAKLPKVVTVDMKEQIKLGSGEVLSIPLRQAIANAIGNNKQAIIFLNRRGFSRSLICGECGEVVSCPNCSVAMTLHNSRYDADKTLICHYCGHMFSSKEAECKMCGSTKLKRAGIGTEQLEEELKRMYPGENVLRMDQDTTMSKGSHERILEAFRNHEASILIGTQMIAKGHDFPDVTVVGIIGADLMANSSNFHSSENAFQLITQASGRAGRKGNEGYVFLQTYNTENMVIKYASTQDYKAFYNEEILYRQKLLLPPFKALGNIMVCSEDEEMARTISLQVTDYLKEYLSYQKPEFEFEVFGPIPAPIYELRGTYRMNTVIKSKAKKWIIAVYNQICKDFNGKDYTINLIFE
ncbi:MAG: primosomal protein N' [Clostridia bacterium]|nr:primosomal protein N' [Clostridia bacterium]